MEVVLEVSVEQVALKPAWLARLLVFLFFLPCTKQIEYVCQAVPFQVHARKMKLPVVLALGGSTKVASPCALGFSNSFKNYLVVVESAF